MSCCKFDVEKITTITGTQVSEIYIDHRTSPASLIDKATYDALVKVKCPEVTTDTENLCIQLIGNTDASLIEEGFRCVSKTITYDAAGAATVAIDNVSLHLSDGTDVTATHEVTACPEPVVSSVQSCVE